MAGLDTIICYLKLNLSYGGYYGTYQKMNAKHKRRYVNEFYGRHNVHDKNTADQMADIVANMVGRRFRLLQSVKLSNHFRRM